MKMTVIGATNHKEDVRDVTRLMSGGLDPNGSLINESVNNLDAGSCIGARNSKGRSNLEPP